MNKKKLGLLALTMSVMMSFAACSSKTAAPKSTENSGKTSEATYEATMAYIQFGNTPADLQLVQDEVNKITVPKINVKVKLMPISMTQYTQQLNLMLSGSEKLDLVSVFNDFYSGLIAKGQLLPLDDLLNKYGSGIKSVISADYLKATTFNGKIYGVTSSYDISKPIGIVLKKDLVDKYNIDMTKVKTMQDLETVLQTIHEKEPNTPLLSKPLAGTYGALGFYTDYVDPLTDGNTGVLMSKDNLKVVNYYETEEYANLVKLMRKWYQAGYIKKDIATSKDEGWADMKAGKASGMLSTVNVYGEYTDSISHGVQVVEQAISPAYLTTTSISGHMWSIARNSEKPEKAMQLLDLLYTNAELNNLLIYGIEGKHYVKTSEANVIDYPQGVTATTVGYSGLNWQFQNMSIAYIQKGTPADYWTKVKEANAKMIKSPALGFAFDPAPVKTEVAAVTNVINQYKVPLESGTVDPEKVLPEFISKLKAAGMDKIIAEKQKQLDTWAQANKK
ncbi:ABC transporter substrate-binding protein [Clostridium sp. SYSU_GA19001]|uniref:ABC transporter substrate-binding protein n=1 Tax=Clostridium caldaquaticum TaxID=2940653 RepID=UPI002076EB2E|nr:ABC transporter substrate-binding protein [Clostridium caldaquaticum]MCM8710044.1 ABC transporter substrate-binding protein [Clostridium caldaquaticum]